MSFTRRTLAVVVALSATGVAVPGAALATTHAAAPKPVVRVVAHQAAPVSSTPATLRVGARGAKVAELQRMLATYRHKVPVTGYFGTATKAAVVAFQKQAGLPANGVVGATTWQTLLCMGD